MVICIKRRCHILIIENNGIDNPSGRRRKVYKHIISDIEIMGNLKIRIFNGEPCIRTPCNIYYKDLSFL